MTANTLSVRYPIIFSEPISQTKTARIRSVKSITLLSFEFSDWFNLLQMQRWLWFSRFCSGSLEIALNRNHLSIHGTRFFNAYAPKRLREPHNFCTNSRKLCTKNYCFCTKTSTVLVENFSKDPVFYIRCHDKSLFFSAPLWTLKNILTTYWLVRLSPAWFPNITWTSLLAWYLPNDQVIVTNIQDNSIWE